MASILKFLLNLLYDFFKLVANEAKRREIEERPSYQSAMEKLKNARDKNSK